MCAQLAARARVRPSVTHAKQRAASVGEAPNRYGMIGATGRTERLAREIAARDSIGGGARCEGISSLTGTSQLSDG
jgi:hypothetical protein